MTFELSEELSSQIAFAMENHDTIFVLDAKTLQLVEKDSINSSEKSRYYFLPEWDSSSGFRMMERFVSIQRNIVLKQKLRSVLFSGKGVFRNFKNVLKSFPEAEKQWFSFREKEMTQHILQWYNLLRDTWGLEKLGEEPEDSEDLIHDDFIFRQYQHNTDEEHLLLASNSIMAEMERDWPGELGVALSDLWQNQYIHGEQKSSFSLIVETVDGDFAGCIATCPCPTYARKTMLLTTFFVLQNYRGLGLGKELLSICLSNLKRQGIRWVILSNMIIPSFLVSCLTRFGFVSYGGGYILDFSKQTE